MTMSSILVTQSWKRTNWQNARAYAVERNGRRITYVQRRELANSIALRERGKVVPVKWA